MAWKNSMLSGRSILSTEARICQTGSPRRGGSMATWTRCAHVRATKAETVLFGSGSAGVWVDLPSSGR